MKRYTYILIGLLLMSLMFFAAYVVNDKLSISIEKKAIAEFNKQVEYSQHRQIACCTYVGNKDEFRIDRVQRIYSEAAKSSNNNLNNLSVELSPELTREITRLIKAGSKSK